jgi:hypothetical protein
MHTHTAAEYLQAPISLKTQARNGTPTHDSKIMEGNTIVILKDGVASPPPALPSLQQAALSTNWMQGDSASGAQTLLAQLPEWMSVSGRHLLMK